MKDQREDALRYLDILELIMILYGALGAATFIVVTFFEIEVLFPVLSVVFVLVMLNKFLMSWEASKELVIKHLNRKRIRTWDDEPAKRGSGVAMSLILFVVFGLVHYFFWSEHTGRMIQIYLPSSIFAFSEIHGYFKEKWQKMGGFVVEQ